MSSPQSSAPIDNTQAATTQATATDATTAGAAVQANSQGTSNIDMNEKISNVSDLQQKAPEVWNAILQGIAQSMISQMQAANAELVQKMKEATKNS